MTCYPETHRSPGPTRASIGGPCPCNCILCAHSRGTAGSSTDRFDRCRCTVQTALRVIDANLNRAREALRCLEDYVRFGLNRQAASDQLRTLRRDVGELAQAFPQVGLLAARDTAHDVGTRETGAQAQTRSTPIDLIRANAARLQEALRSIEEAARLLSPPCPTAAHAAEQLRYRAYQLEQSLAGLFLGPGRFDRVQLYLLLTCRLCARPWRETLLAAIAGGVDCVQVREKSMSDRDLLSHARAVAELCQSQEVLWVMNDRPDIARLADADGVHVGQDDLPVADVRRVVGPMSCIGLSTHSPQQAQEAGGQPLDWIAAGPVFASSTKPEAASQWGLLGPDGLAQVVQSTNLAVVAIGGTNARNAGLAAQSGARGIAVSNAILSHPDPAEAAAQIKEAFGQSASKRKSLHAESKSLDGGPPTM